MPPRANPRPRARRAAGRLAVGVALLAFAAAPTATALAGPRGHGGPGAPVPPRPAADLPVTPPPGFGEWREPAPGVLVAGADGVLLELRPLAARVHADVDPGVAADEMAQIAGAPPRASARPGGAGISFEWGDDRAGAAAVLVPNGATAFLVSCRWDPPARTRARARDLARARCVEALAKARATTPPPAQPPITPPPGFRRGLGPSADVAWFGMDDARATILVQAYDEPLDADLSDDGLSRLTDSLVGDGMQVNALDRVRLEPTPAGPAEALDAVRFSGKVSHGPATIEVLGWLLPRGGETLAILAVVPGGAADRYAPTLEAVARGARGLAPPPAARARDRAANAPGAGASARRGAARGADASDRGGGLADGTKAALVAGGLALGTLLLTVAMVGWQGRERRRRRRAAIERARRGPDAR